MHGAACSSAPGTPPQLWRADNTSLSTRYDTYLRRETLPPPTPKPIQSHDLICYQSPGYEYYTIQYYTQQSRIVGMQMGLSGADFSSPIVNLGEGGGLRQHLFTQHHRHSSTHISRRTRLLAPKSITNPYPASKSARPTQCKRHAASAGRRR